MGEGGIRGGKEFGGRIMLRELGMNLGEQGIGRGKFGVEFTQFTRGLLGVLGTEG